MVETFPRQFPLGVKPTLSMLYSNNKVAITFGNNKTFSGKNRYVRLRHKVKKQLPKDRTISLDYVKS